MYQQVEKPKENKSRAVANAVAQKKHSMKQDFGFVDNRPEAIAQRRLQSKINSSRVNGEVSQRVAIGTINCPNWGNVMDLGSAIHSRLQADYIANGTAHATWLRGAEFTTPTGQRADLTLRTPGMGLIRSVGEIKPLASQAAGAAQIAAHLANMPANGLNAAHPVINDGPWAAAASFPVADIDAGGGSPSGNVNVTPVAGTPGLYTYNG